MTKKSENQNKVDSVNPRLTTIAEQLNVPLKEEETLTEEALIEAIAARVESIQKRVEPLLKLVNSDQRARTVLKMALAGEGVDKILSHLNEELYNSQSNNYRNAVCCANSFCENHQLQPTDIERFINFLDSTIGAISKGEMTNQMLESLWHCFNFDNEIEGAYKAGVIAGRNSKIEAAREERTEDNKAIAVAAGRVVEPTPQPQGYIERLIKSRR